MVGKLRPIRLWITAGILLCAFVFLQSMSHGEATVARMPLNTLSYTVGTWTATDQPLTDDMVKATGVSDYTHRLYTASAQPPIDLYVGYYSTQRTGDTIHSPKNCLPGSGWDPVRSGYATIPIPNAKPIVVNEYVIQQQDVKQLVFYWYQGRGRVVASEYAGKFWMIADAISRNRTDGALVRLITPIGNNETSARARLMSFAETIFPSLSQLIPN